MESIQPLTADHRQAVIDIFNHYVTDSFAAYPETPVPYQFFDMFLSIADHYPAVVAADEQGQVLGFALLRPFNPMPAFKHSAEITYFIAPDHTGRGLGSRLLAHLEGEASARGIDNLLADISSLNPGSIAFHQRHGFTQCGRFEGVGLKFGRDFDQVWMQKRLLPINIK
jgi:phosphinothricin acetyltransferase